MHLHLWILNLNQWNRLKLLPVFSECLYRLIRIEWATQWRKPLVNRKVCKPFWLSGFWGPRVAGWRNPSTWPQFGAGPGLAWWRIGTSARPILGTYVTNTPLVIRCIGLNSNPLFKMDRNASAASVGSKGCFTIRRCKNFSLRLTFLSSVIQKKGHSSTIFDQRSNILFKFFVFIYASSCLSL